MKLRHGFVGMTLILGGLFVIEQQESFESSRDPASGSHHHHHRLGHHSRQPLSGLQTTPPTPPTPPPADLPILQPEDRPQLDLSSFRFPLVLMYHDIVATAAEQVAGSDVLVGTFKAEMQMLKARGYTTITLDELHEATLGNFVLPERSVLITFDDGYIGDWNFAFPYLKEQAMKASFFVHTNYVGTQTEKLHMSWEQLRTIDADPLFKVMSHTLTHADLPSLTMDLLIKEVRDSRAMVELMLGGSRPYFAYPYGKHGPASLSITRKYYDMAFVVGTPSADRRIEASYQIPRMSMVRTQSIEQFGQAIQAFDEDSQSNPLQ